MVFEIRPYQPADREAVFCMAADTAFFGQPVEAFLPDRRIMQDAFVRYYTDCESRFTWIADVDGTVAGYLTGGIDSAQATLFRARAAAGALGRLVLGRYRLGRRGWSYFARLAGAALRGEYPRADLRPYPAHLHINLADRYRGLGLGRRLLEACFRQMAGVGLDGIHLNTTNLNAAAIRLYERMDFQLLDSRPTRLWESLLPNTLVLNLLYGRRLFPADVILGHV